MGKKLICFIFLVVFSRSSFADCVQSETFIQTSLVRTDVCSTGVVANASQSLTILRTDTGQLETLHLSSDIRERNSARCLNPDRSNMQEATTAAIRELNAYKVLIEPKVSICC